MHMELYLNYINDIKISMISNYIIGQLYHIIISISGSKHIIAHCNECIIIGYVAIMAFGAF